MAIDQTKQLTLAELTKRLHPSEKKLADIAEILEESNEILTDLKFIEANNITSHITTVRERLPEASTRMLNEYVGNITSDTRQIEEHICMLAAYETIDKKLVELSGDKTGLLMGEVRAAIEGIGQQAATLWFYGNRADDPGEINGLANRYNALSHANVWDNGGNSNRTSIWVLQHDLDKVHGVYPRGSKSGIDHQDLGEQTATDGSGKQMQVFRHYFTWDMGLVVRNYKAVQRVANVDSTTTSSFAFDNKLIAALNQMPKRGKGSVIYVNRDVFTMMDIYAKDKTNMAYGSMKDAAGQEVTTFRGLPVRLVEALLSTEDAVA
ncbi:MAG: hypothetical protein K9L68_13855 [Spirochaetales bacterium]|nr:hypothetical protein [Spirochaetales bacterium]